MAEQLAAVSGDLPHTRVPERDPWALRAAVTLLFVVAFAFSFGPLGGSVADAFRPQSAIDAIPPRIDAWVTPPAYTGKAPIFLTSEANQAAPMFTVPEGSDVALRVTGGTGEETLSFSDASGNVRDIARKRACRPGQTRRNRPAVGAAPVLGQAHDRRHAVAEVRRLPTFASWAFAVIPDKPPVIKFSGEPKRAVNGALELNYDDRRRLWRGLGRDRLRAGRAAREERAPALRGARNAARPAAPRRPGSRRQDLRAT